MGPRDDNRGGRSSGTTTSLLSGKDRDDHTIGPASETLSRVVR